MRAAGAGCCPGKAARGAAGARASVQALSEPHEPTEDKILSKQPALQLQPRIFHRCKAEFWTQKRNISDLGNQLSAAAKGQTLSGRWGYRAQFWHSPKRPSDLERGPHPPKSLWASRIPTLWAISFSASSWLPF